MTARAIGHAEQPRALEDERRRGGGEEEVEPAADPPADEPRLDPGRGEGRQEDVARRRSGRSAAWLRTGG